ncbi:hypothetical protein MMJ17_24590, partial [Bacillus spizizenii]|nr:hypothetical protein [Bacillus spizizenii]
LQNGTAFEHATSVDRGDRYKFVHYMDRLSTKNLQSFLRIGDMAQI